MKKILSIMIAILSCLSMWTSTVFADDYVTKYRPWRNVPGGWAADPFALQRAGYPWCLNTCMKIVLRNALERRIGTGTNLGDANGPVEANIDFLKIDALVNPVGEDPLLVDEAIVKNLFFKKKAIGEINTFSTHTDNQMEFKNTVMDGLFKHYLGNHNIKTRIAALDHKRRFDLFNGLLGAAGTKKLEEVWRSLTDNTKKMIVQESAQAVLDTVQEMTSAGADGSGLKGTIVDAGNYSDALNEIARQNAEKKMVIVVFRDPQNSSSRHACVAFGTRISLDGTAADDNTLLIYNPWGWCIRMDSKNAGPVLNIALPEQPSMYWELCQYITFNY